jgi:hypothetical protein
MNIIDELRSGIMFPTPDLFGKMMDIVDFYDKNSSIHVDRDKLDYVFRFISNHAHGVAGKKGYIVAAKL